MTPEPVPGVRGAVLAPDDPVRDEWDIAVVGPHFAGALVARDLGDDGPDADRRFEFVLTYDRDLAVEIASSLMRRIHPDPNGTRALGSRTAPTFPGAAAWHTGSTGRSRS